MTRFFQRQLAFLALILLATLLTTTQIACSCTDTLTAEEEAEKKKKEDDEKKKKGKKEKAKADFEFRDTRTIPSEVVSNTPRNNVKPGHWTTVGSTVVANNFDFQAELHSAAVDELGNPLDVDHTNFFLRSRRPAPLPKGQPKFFESTCYVPRRLLPDNNQFTIGNSPRMTRLESDLTAVGGGRELEIKQDPVTVMDDYQYFMIVLASNPNAYSYLRAMDTIAPRYTGSLSDGIGQLLPHYKFTAPQVTKSIPLPSTALTWTSVAVIVWDDIDPSLFTQDQQQALLDWLHWGGQLVISGPRSLDRLRGSFLEPYLPAIGGESEQLTVDAFAEINESFGLTATQTPKKPEPLTPEPGSIPGLPPGFPVPPNVPDATEPKPDEPEKKREEVPLFDRNDPTFRIQVLAGKPVLGVKLELQPNGNFVPNCGGLMAERWAGQGRVVATSFPLTDARIYNWRNFDNFLNNAILRRPPRRWNMTQYEELQLTWDGSFQSYLRDARLVCNLRYFSRDIGKSVSANRSSQQAAKNQASPEEQVVDLAAIRSPGNSGETRIATTGNLQPAEYDWHCAGYSSEPESGVAGWNDFSGAADAAKQALKDAAKVKIPKADFVFKMVALYLIVLVPVNWLIFRAMGRVEWAWFAAPVIAITAAGIVIRMAQLDIGFVRSRTDIGIVEFQAGFDRAHVTRYTALYTSLSTGYDLAFVDPSALALPLAEDKRYKRNPIQDAALQITFQRDKSATMQGFQVDSSSTAWTHSEQMLSTGQLTLSGDAAVGFKVKNETEFNIRDVGVLQRQGNQFNVAWLAELAPQTTVPLKFAAFDEPLVEQWQSSDVMSEQEEDEGDDVRLWRLAELATRQLGFMDGEVRLVGWTDDDLPGLEIRPTSSQFTRRSLILAHLHRPPLGAPKPDANVQADVDRAYGRALNDDDFAPATEALFAP